MQNRRSSHLIALVLLSVVAATACAPSSREAAPVPVDVVGATVEAPDGVPIVYDARGRGDTALVFIHCWACNRDFWREQIDALTDSYRVVTFDLGGHGESGTGRDDWTIAGLAPDVVAVADALDLQRMVLIGHSMGGPVALEAARLMPGRVIGIVAVDSLQNADFKFPPEVAERMLAAFDSDFEGTMRNMFNGMSAPAMDPALRDWIVEQALATQPEVTVALLRDFSNLDFPAMFRAAGVPIRGINAAGSEASFPTNIEGNRKYADYDAVVIDDVGHFIQLQRPEAFNERLRAILAELTSR